MEKRISFISKAENINYIERLVDEVSSEYNIGPEIYGNMMVTMVEAVNNAILHGNKLDPTKNVEVKLYKNNDSIYFEVSDEGDGFDYNNLPDPTDPQNIEKPHGRGIFLMKNLADEVTFLNNGSRVKIKFKLKS